MNTINEKYNDFQNISKVKELSVFNDVNEHIKLGWKLLDTYKTTASNQVQTINYCLGWPKSTPTDKTRVSINKTSTVDPKATKKFLYSL